MDEILKDMNHAIPDCRFQAVFWRLHFPDQLSDDGGVFLLRHFDCLTGNGFDSFLVGGLRNLIQQTFNVADLSRLLGEALIIVRQKLLLFVQLSLLVFKDVIPLLQILLAAVDSFLLDGQAMLFADFQKKIPADFVEAHLPVIELAGLLVGLWERDAELLQRFLLLGFVFTVFVFNVEDLPCVNVRAGLIQMQRPVEDMDIGTEAILKSGKEFLNDVQERFRRGTITLLADLVNGFLGADPDVGEQIFDSAVSLGMAGFLVAGVLSGDESAVASLIFVVFQLRKRDEFSGAVVLMRPEAALAVPVNISGGTGRIDVFGVFELEAAVVVFGIIRAMLSGAAVVAGYAVFFV